VAPSDSARGLLALGRCRVSRAGTCWRCAARARARAHDPSRPPNDDAAAVDDAGADGDDTGGGELGVGASSRRVRAGLRGLHRSCADRRRHRRCLRMCAARSINAAAVTRVGVGRALCARSGRVLAGRGAPCPGRCWRQPGISVPPRARQPRGRPPRVSAASGRRSVSHRTTLAVPERDSSACQRAAQNTHAARRKLRGARRSTRARRIARALVAIERTRLLWTDLEPFTPACRVSRSAPPCAAALARADRGDRNVPPEGFNWNPATAAEIFRRAHFRRPASAQQLRSFSRE
jgi:hypothetical protein